MFDRYDARGHLSELSQFESSSYDFVPTPEEKEIEKLCDKERYLALEPNEEEHLMYQGKFLNLTVCVCVSKFYH